MTTFPITPAIRRHLGPALTQAFPRRDWHVRDIAATDDTLTVYKPLTAEDVAAVQNVIDRIDAALAEQEAVRRANTNTFAWMRERQAQQWQRAMSPKERVR